MANRAGLGLNRAKKLLLASAGIAALAGPFVVGIDAAPAVQARSDQPAKPQDSAVIPSPQEKPLAFDAASIKLAAAPAGGRARVGDGSFRYPPGRVMGSAPSRAGTRASSSAVRDFAAGV